LYYCQFFFPIVEYRRNQNQKFGVKMLYLPSKPPINTLPVDKVIHELIPSEVPAAPQRLIKVVAPVVLFTLTNNALEG
jgi:hypothetical protein